MKKATKVMWFSRHAMKENQLAALKNRLGEIEITMVNGSIENVHLPFRATDVPENTPNAVLADMPAMKELVKGFDVIAAVLPVNLQQQLLPVIGDKPLIMAVNDRQPDGSFVFQKWIRVAEVKVVTEDF